MIHLSPFESYPRKNFEIHIYSRFSLERGILSNKQGTFQNANKQKIFILILIFKNKIQKGAQDCRSTDFPYKLRIYCWVSFLPLNIRSSFQYFSQHSIRTNFFPLKVFYMLPFRKKLQNHEKLKHFIFNKYSNFGSIYQENK